MLFSDNTNKSYFIWGIGKGDHQGISHLSLLGKFWQFLLESIIDSSCCSFTEQLHLSGTFLVQTGFLV